MTKFITSFVFFLITSIYIEAQVSFSCYYREYCVWNSYSETYNKCTGEKEASLFRMNENETMFTHTTESIASTYYVNEKTHNDELNVWIYDVTSDVGNNYLYIFDPKNKEIRVAIIDDGETYLARFYVKSIF